MLKKLKFSFPKISLTWGSVVLCLTFLLAGIFFLLAPRETGQVEIPLDSVVPLSALSKKKESLQGSQPQKSSLKNISDIRDSDTVEPGLDGLESPLGDKERIKLEETLNSASKDMSGPHSITSFKAETKPSNREDESINKGAKSTTVGEGAHKSPELHNTEKDTHAEQGAKDTENRADKSMLENSQNTALQTTESPLPAFIEMPLNDAPHAQLACLEKDSQNGFLLPQISMTGLRPFDVYQRAANTDPKRKNSGKPKLSIFIRELGNTKEIFEYILTSLPHEISYVFFSYGSFSKEQNIHARSHDIETWLHIPLEPLLYPQHDPGFEPLLTNTDPGENLMRLKRHMSQLTGYIGVFPYLGSRFGRVQRDFQPILHAISARGLAYVESNRLRSKAFEWHAPNNWLHAQVTLDVQRGLSDSKLDRLFSQATGLLEQGESIILSFEPDKRALEKLRTWLQTLDSQAITLVPVSQQIQEQ